MTIEIISAAPDTASHMVGLSDWITALSTLVLAAFTILLVFFTKRLADVTNQPSVVVTFEPSPRSMMYMDLHIENDGTAAAYDVEVSFDPAITLLSAKPEPKLPFSNISVLKPGQKLVSLLTSCTNMQGKSYNVTITWKRSPSSHKRDRRTYTIDMSSFDGMSRLGDDPMIQIADELRMIREQWESVANGRNRIQTDTFDGADRQAENEERARWRDDVRRRQEQDRAPSVTDQLTEVESAQKSSGP